MKKTGFIAIVGKPNVGKSTLLNTMLGEKIAIVSDKPQTTRNRVTGILTKDDTQYVFMDTPGMHNPKNKLGDFMMRAANDTLTDVDVVLYVVEADKHISPTEEQLMDKLSRGSIPSILIINKIDIANGEKVGKTIQTFSEKHDFDAVIPVSAMKGKGIETIFEELEPFMNECEDWFFPDDIITDQPERQIAAEVIREKILRLTNDEIPHGTAVVIEAFEEKKDLVSIRAEIFCEKDSHKGILIGKHGATLKKIGTYAREDLEKFLGVKVYLDLWVKVKENWRDSAAQVANFGFVDD
ncbi:MAG: GTPase Era [Clostridia bacterium]|nr:GTPase Era [Clostridia bacterium]